MGAYGVPARRDRVRAFPREGDPGLVEALVDAHEGVAIRVEAGYRPGAGEEAVVAPPLAVFGLVEDAGPAALGPVEGGDLDLADGPGALVVGHVVEGLVEAELLEGEKLGLFPLPRKVRDTDLPDLLVPSGGDEEGELDLEAVLDAEDALVAQAHAAFVAVAARLDRLPARIPDRASVINVEVAAPEVEGDVVVAVAREPSEAGVLPEGVAAPGVGAEAEEVVLAQIVEPGEGGIGSRDHIFAGGVVEIAVIHGVVPLPKARGRGARKAPLARLRARGEPPRRLWTAL